jgi:tryptophanyl-tRNA synthetase
MNEFKQKHLRKLKNEARQTNKEHKETLEIFNEAQREFVEAILSYCQDHNIPSPLTERKEGKKNNTKKEEEVFLEPEVKMVYKRIAIATHPDKLLNLNEKDKEERELLFKKAATAKGDKDLNELTQIATELKINLHELKYAHLELLEQQIKEKEQKIEDMHQDVAWHWYYLSPKQRLEVISSICEADES